MSGYLRKKYGKNGAKWRRFWFVLKDGTLYAYKAPEDSVPCDTFSILGFILETLSEVDTYIKILVFFIPGSDQKDVSIGEKCFQFS